MSDKKLDARRVIEITADQLPLHCPTPEMSQWNAHPRVFLAVHKTGEEVCPYCSTKYILKGGPVKGHH